MTIETQEDRKINGQKIDGQKIDGQIDINIDDYRNIDGQKDKWIER